MILKWNYVSLTKINVMINISQTELQSRTHTHDTFIPRTRLRQGERAFSVTAAHHWNRLATDIRCISNTEQFKLHLKMFMFKSAFTDCYHDSGLFYMPLQFVSK